MARVGSETVEPDAATMTRSVHSRYSSEVKTRQLRKKKHAGARLQDLRLSPRCAQRLTMVGISSLTQLLKYTPEELWAKPGMGGKSVRDIRIALSRLGLSLRTLGPDRLSR